MFKKILISLLILFSVFFYLIPTVSAAQETVYADGGTVKNYEELFNALGGESAVSIKYDKNDSSVITHIQIYKDIILKNPLIVTGGEYVIYGSGSRVTFGFEKGDLITVSGENTKLKLGNPNGGDKDDTVFTANNSNRNGSFLHVENGASAEIFYGTVFKDILNSSSGGAIVNDGKLTLYDCDISNCRSVGSGGAIYNRSELIVAKAAIKNCSSDLGGAVFSEGDATFISLEISECNALKGGAIYNSGSIKFGSSSVNSCSASEGGGVYNNGSFEMIGGSISGCESEGGTGGGIYNTKTLKLSSGNVDGNSAENGGNIYNGGTLELENRINVNEGKAGLSGGNIYNTASGQINLTGGNITLGTAENGGGIYNLGEIIISGGNISANKADVGSGILNHGKARLSKSGYVDPKNDFFAVLSEENIHALYINSDWIYDRQVIALSCGRYDNGSYSYDNAVGSVVVINNSDADISKRFSVYKNESLIINQKGIISKAQAKVSKTVIYIAVIAVAFVLTVTVMVTVIRFIDRRKEN